MRSQHACMATRWFIVLVLSMLAGALGCAAEDAERGSQAGQAGVPAGAAGTLGGVGAFVPVAGQADPAMNAAASGAAGASAGLSGAMAGTTAGAMAGTTAGAMAGTTAGAMAGDMALPTAGVAPSTGGMDGASGMQAAVATVATLYWLDINANRVYRSQELAAGEVIVSRTHTAPDGIAVDVEGGKIYWSNMGSLLGRGGGSVQRANLDGSQVETVLAAGTARTPKQLQLDLVSRHVYFCDREGVKVWRVGMDGSSPTAVVSGHGFRELVGVALDVPAGKLYFSDRIGKKILRTSLTLPAGQTGETRTDIEEMIVLAGNAMPIDLDIDHRHGRLYWTDRGLGTVHRAGLEIPAGQTASNRSDLETLVTGLSETIGITLDVDNDRMYFTELGGRVSSSALDGSGLSRRVLSSGSATGIAIAHIPH